MGACREKMATIPHILEALRSESTHVMTELSAHRDSTPPAELQGDTILESVDQRRL
jgi:hypothetical protein